MRLEMLGNQGKLSARIPIVRVARTGAVEPDPGGVCVRRHASYNICVTPLSPESFEGGSP
jgi:hypothetical protein